ncbi:MAG: hypothetical protein IJP48_06115 [Synergistaceae bacterium]|nr:hypothetical protein [Synergistaceae bacterium]
MNAKIFSRYKAFTFMEILIIIVVVGAISVYMAFSGINIIMTSRAASIVIDMQHIRTAAMIYDRNVKPNNTPNLNDIRSYLTSDSNFDALAENFSIESNNNDEWFVKYEFANLSSLEKRPVARKVAERAVTAGLLARRDDESVYNGSSYVVYMKIR